MEELSSVESPSPKKTRRSLFSEGDRFIPNRSSLSAALESGLDASGLIPEENVYKSLLQQELLPQSTAAKISSILQLRSPPISPPKGSSPTSSKFSVSPLSDKAEQLLLTPRKTPRRISKVAVKVLDAPSLKDDFYLNLVDWSAGNVLAVGLNSCVYLWHASNGRVSRLCDVGPSDHVAAAVWAGRGTQLAVGTNSGAVVVYDVQRQTVVSSLVGHSARVGVLAWNGENVLSSGGRDRTITHHDIRASTTPTMTLTEHRQEVCGLQWSPDGRMLASGGNDNKLLIWSLNSPRPLMRFSEHTAAVKALAWSPHQHGILASGGGTADRTIRIWSTTHQRCINAVDTGSQVCNLLWAKSVNELVSTHGYSHNHTIVWRMPNLEQVATLKGHTLRVLYLSLSPDGQTVVTGAGDETLRFWKVFPPIPSRPVNAVVSALDEAAAGIR